MRLGLNYKTPPHLSRGEYFSKIVNFSQMVTETFSLKGKTFPGWISVNSGKTHYCNWHDTWFKIIVNFRRKTTLKITKYSKGFIFEYFTVIFKCLSKNWSKRLPANVAQKNWRQVRGPWKSDCLVWHSDFQNTFGLRCSADPVLEYLIRTACW